MPHEHHHGPANYNRVFAVGVAFNVGYIIIEAVFGILANSLALLADAGHNLSDVLGLLLAWGANYLSRVKPTERHTYGWRSSSILAALANGLILLVAVGGIVWEAVRRFSEPQAVAGSTVMWVAGAGVIINTATALLFLKGRHSDLNIKGAFLHMAADAGVSFAVVGAGIGIYFLGWQWIDPITSLAVALVIFFGTWTLLREAFDLALDAVPSEIDPTEVREFLAKLPGIDEVHDLHIWAMSTTETALTAHLVKVAVENDDSLLAKACHQLREKFGIHHVTLQIERSALAARCGQSLDDSL